MAQALAHGAEELLELREHLPALHAQQLLQPALGAWTRRSNMYNNYDVFSGLAVKLFPADSVSESASCGCWRIQACGQVQGELLARDRVLAQRQAQVVHELVEVELPLDLLQQAQDDLPAPGRSSGERRPCTWIR